MTTTAITTIAFEDRSVAADYEVKGRTVTGYAAIFDSRSYVGPTGQGFWEEVSPGAFTNALAEDDIRLTRDHSPTAVLARYKAGSGTLRLSQDSRGLHFEAGLPNTTAANDLIESMSRQDVTGASFRFITPPEREAWSVLPDGSELRSLQSLRLLDVSVVAYPAYDDATASLRSRDLALASPDFANHVATRDLRRKANAWARLLGPERNAHEQ